MCDMREFVEYKILQLRHEYDGIFKEYSTIEKELNKFANEGFEIEFVKNSYIILKKD